MSTRLWHSFTVKNFVNTVKADIVKPLQWPFALAAGIYLLAMAKIRLSGSEEAKLASPYLNRENINKEKRAHLVEYQNEARLVKLLHLRAQTKEAPAPPAAH